MTDRLIRVIDFEATTAEKGGRVIEVGWCDIDPVTLTIGRPDSYLCGGVLAPLPPDARAVHHIRHEDIAHLPPYDRRLVFEHGARAGVVSFAAHSADFEAQHLMGSIPLVCTYKAALRVWPDAPKHSVFALLYMLEDQGLAYDRGLAWPPHRAAADAYATATLLREILRLGHTGADLFEWTREPAMLPRCPMGDWRGYKWADVETSFLEWILRKVRDREDVRFCASRELARRYPEEDF